MLSVIYGHSEWIWPHFWNFGAVHIVPSNAVGRQLSRCWNRSTVLVNSSRMLDCVVTANSTICKSHLGTAMNEALGCAVSGCIRVNDTNKERQKMRARRREGGSSVLVSSNLLDWNIVLHVSLDTLMHTFMKQHVVRIAYGSLQSGLAVLYNTFPWLLTLKCEDFLSPELVSEEVTNESIFSLGFLARQLEFERSISRCHL